jgi:hypothetical protein
MPSFSKEEVVRARQTDIVSYLESVNEKARAEGRVEPYPMRQDGKGEIRVSGHGGLLVNKNYWSVQSQKVMQGDKLVVLGGNTLDFLVKYEGKSFAEAVTVLNGREFEKKTIADKPRAYVPKDDKGDFVIPERHENARRAIAYLTKTRYLDPQIVIDQVKKGNIYEEKGYHNAIFIGRSPDNEPRWANKRSTLTDKSFKGDQRSSDPRYPFLMRNSQNKNDGYVIVTESPIEAMSYATIIKIQGGEPYKNDIMGVGGAHGVGLLQYLQDHPQTRGVILALNNDRQGLESTELIRNELQAHGFMDRKNFSVRDMFPRDAEDWNDFLKNLIQQKEAQKRLNEERGIVGEVMITLKPGEAPQKFQISKDKVLRNGSEVIVLYGEKSIATLNPNTKTFAVSERGNKLKDTYFVKKTQIDTLIKEQVISTVEKALEEEVNKLTHHSKDGQNKRLSTKELLTADPKELSAEEAIKAYALKKQIERKNQQPQRVQEQSKSMARERVQTR